MSHPLHLKKCCVLATDDMNVLENIERIGSRPSNISQPVSVLRENTCGGNNAANRVFYAMDDERLLQRIPRMKICIFHHLALSVQKNTGIFMPK